MSQLKNAFRQLFRYPSAVAGLSIILLLVVLAVYTLIAIPYDDAIRLWRGGEEVWGESPRLAQPTWTNLFRRNDLPDTLVLDTAAGTASKELVSSSDKGNEYLFEFTFDFPYADFPQELSLFYTAKYKEKDPFISMTWLTPDGREVRIADFSIKSSGSYRFIQDEKLLRRLNGIPVEQGLFVDPDAEVPFLLQGEYTLRVEVLGFEPDTVVDAKLVVYGKVYGLAGTDHRRRDITVALLWGTPIALSFGLLAALGTTVTTMFIAAVGVWFGGWVDEAIQRITEVNLVLPVLPILIMIGTFYSRGILIILGVTVLLGIFGFGIKSYRAIFLQVREAPYIEAARAYGSSNVRIIIRYLIPRVIPLIIPGLVVGIPGYVFLEASLAVLGLGDPVLPTWGKVINDARANGALFEGHYYWVLQPAVLLMLTGLAFSMVGFSLDRVFNPRLRGL